MLLITYTQNAIFSTFTIVDLKKVCEQLSQKNQKSYVGNNITNKLRRKTIKFEEVQEIVDTLGYHIEFVRNKT